MTDLFGPGWLTEKLDAMEDHTYKPSATERAWFVMQYGDAKRCPLDNLPMGHGGTHFLGGGPGLEWTRRFEKAMEAYNE